MSLNSISLIMATVIMNIKRRSLGDPPPPVPRMLMHVCENVLARLLCSRMANWKRIAAGSMEHLEKLARASTAATPAPGDEQLVNSDSESSEETQFIQLRDMTLEASDKLAENGRAQNNILARDDAPLMRTETTALLLPNSSANDLFSREFMYTDGCLHVGPCASESHDNFSFMEDDSDNESIACPPGGQQRTCTEHRTNRQRSAGRSDHRSSYRKAIRYGQFKQLPIRAAKHRAGQTYEMEQISGKYQWYFVADVIDTTMFLIYLIIMTASIITVLVILPMFA